LSVFFNRDFYLRSGWRFTTYVSVFVVLLFANGALMALIFGGVSVNESDVALLGINALAFLLPAVLALMFMSRFVDHVPAAAFGVGIHERWIGDFGIGLGIAGLMLGFYSGFGLVLGDLSIESLPKEGGFWHPWILTIVILTVSAANEELLFRGYPLQVLMVAIGRWPAMVAMSALFGLGHHLNPNATWLGTLNTFLAGILLCLAYMRTRSLWFPYGIHIGWNLAIGPILGFAVSGITMPSFWRSQVTGSEWLSGGAYGPEGGILGTGVMLTAIVAVVMTGSVCTSSTVRTLLDQHARAVYSRDLPATLDVGFRKSRKREPSARDAS
jgi:membrane protease YdiL (CAAX protease family)